MILNILEKNVNKIKDYIDMNMFAKSIYRTSDLDIYIIKLVDNSVNIFKTVRGNFVYDLLDYSYLNGLELICLEDKLISTALKTDLKNGYKSVSHDMIKKVLNNMVKPQYLVYVVYDVQLGYPYTIKIDMGDYEGLTYVELKDIIFYTYKKYNKESNYDNLKICLIDYIK